jgi:hypothetical protein
VKSRHNEATLSDRKHQFCLINGVVSGKIGGLESQHHQKERVKWQERTTVISVSGGSFSKMSEVGVTALRSGQFIARRCNSIEVSQFIRKKV